MLVTRQRIFCTTLFTNNKIKVVIQMHAFLFDPESRLIDKKDETNSILSSVHTDYSIVGEG